MQVPMLRVDIIAPTSSVDRVLRSVHRAGVVHLAPFEPGDGAGSIIFHGESSPAGVGAGRGSPYDAAQERLAGLAALLTLPPPPSELVREAWESSDDALFAQVRSLEPVAREAAELSAELLRLRGEADRLAGYRRIIEGLRRAIGHLPSVRGYGSTGIVVRSRYRAVIGLIQEELEAITQARCEVISADIDAERVAAVLIYPLRLVSEVRSLLGGRDLEEVTLPESLVAVPFDELAPRLASEEATLRQRASSTAAEIALLAREHGPGIAALRAVLDDRIAESRVLGLAGRSDHLSVISGWIPASRLAGLRERLARDVGADVLVIDRPADPAGRSTPVALDNRRVLRAFEPLASFVALPRYGTVDPTPAVAFAFPLFVGLMVGDVGYGLILLAVLALARWRWRTAPAMSLIWPVGVLAGVSTVIFGLLFGEAFGDAGHAVLGLQPLWLDRRDAMLPFLILAISIGVAQIGLGLILGIVNANRMRHRREALGRAALLLSLGAGVVGLAAMAGALAPWTGPVAAAGLLVAIVVMTATLGLAGPIELMGMIGNVLSYARLMAIGLASVMLALIANRMGGLSEDLVLGLVIAAVFHVLAIVLGFFDASVQGLRLQYVEFFSKFVEPGGTRYEPFTAVVQDRGARTTPARAGGS